MKMTPDELKAKRREAYQRAKMLRDNDPAYQALQEKIKNDRRARYQAFKAQRKTEKEALKRERQRLKDEELAQTFGLSHHLKLLKFDG